MEFKKLLLSEWKQFETLEIEFHPQLTVLTGANSSGKTTILNILANHFQWNIQEVSTPAKDGKTGIITFFARFFKKSRTDLGNVIGKLTYSNDSESDIIIPDNPDASYRLKFKNQQKVFGFYVPSHRDVYYYRNVSQISTQKRKKDQAFQLVSNSIRDRTQSGGGQPSNYHVKETLLNWAIAGGGNEFIESDEELIAFYRGFEDVLKNVLPPNLGFESLAIRNYEVVLITKSGDFLIDAVSGGVSTLIDLAWQVFTFPNNEPNRVTVLIDEVENHLHASMQRTILPDFLRAFPNVQFIIATHSPLIVGSVRDSNVYALRYNDSNKVFSEILDFESKAKSATDILREVLGVPFSMPIWVEETLKTIVDKYSSVAITQETFTEMRNELSQLGLEELMPLTIKQTLDK